MEKPNIDGKVMVPLSLMGRDEADIKKMLWLTGTCKVILWRVGYEMLRWVRMN